MSASHYAPDTREQGDTWRNEAACADDRYAGHRDLWYADSNDREAIAAARRVCHSCPVEAECLEDAMRAEGGKGKDSRHGIRGGLTGSQRRRLYEARAKAKATPEAPTAPAKTGRPPAACGTRSAYQRHVRNREPIDAACRRANTAADNRLRRTGTTKVLT